jgi:hypothetical protein
VTVRVAVVVVSSRIGDREGFSVADGADVGLGGANDSSVGRLDESTELGLVGVGLGISGRAADLVGVGRDTVGVSSWLAERDGDAGPSMFPPPAHDVSTATAAAKPAIFMTSVPNLPPDPALLHTPNPRCNHCLELDTLRLALLASHRSVVRTEPYRSSPASLLVGLRRSWRGSLRDGADGGVGQRMQAGSGWTPASLLAEFGYGFDHHFDHRLSTEVLPSAESLFTREIRRPWTCSDTLPVSGGQRLAGSCR